MCNPTNPSTARGFLNSVAAVLNREQVKKSDNVKLAKKSALTVKRYFLRVSRIGKAESIRL